MTRYLGNIPHKPQIENKYLTKKQHRILRIKYPVAKLNIRPQVQLKESFFAVGSKYWISQMFAYEVRNIRRNYYIFHFFTLLKICSVPISYFVFRHTREKQSARCVLQKVALKCFACTKVSFLITENIWCNCFPMNFFTEHVRTTASSLFYVHKKLPEYVYLFTCRHVSRTYRGNLDILHESN